MRKLSLVTMLVALSVPAGASAASWTDSSPKASWTDSKPTASWTDARLAASWTDRTRGKRLRAHT
jgi:hypothetical protein